MPMAVFFKWQRFMVERNERHEQPAALRPKTPEEMMTILERYRPLDHG